MIHEKCNKYDQNFFLHKMQSTRIKVACEILVIGGVSCRGDVVLLLWSLVVT